MCDAVTVGLAISMAGLSAGNVAAQIHSQGKQAQAAGESATNAATADYMATSEAADQTNAAANAEALKLKRQALIERGRLIAAQSETGFIGNSPIRELNNQRLREQEALGTLEVNQANALVQNSRESNKIFSNAQSRFNEAIAGRTGGLAAGLMIASGGVQGGVQGYTLGRGIMKPKQKGS
jgi:hypothetical protein